MVRTTPSTLFGISNRVEHQKLNQVVAELPTGWALMFNSRKNFTVRIGGWSVIKRVLSFFYFFFGISYQPPPGWVFGVQLGLWQTQALFKTKSIKWGKVPPAILLLCRKHYYFVVKSRYSSNITGGTIPLLIFLVLTSAFVCQRPSWTPKTQPGGGQLGYSCRKKGKRWSEPCRSSPYKMERSSSRSHRECSRTSLGG